MRVSASIFFVLVAGSTVALAAPPHVEAPGAGTAPGTPSNTGVAVGVSPPILSTERVAGADPVDLNGLAGRVVVLDFWATWCQPCRPVSRLLNQLHRDYHDRGLSVVGISRESSDAIRAHLTRSPVAYTIARDLGPTVSRYRVRTLPTLVIVGRDGKVRHMMVGMSRERAAQLIQMVPRLLREPAP